MLGDIEVITIDCGDKVYCDLCSKDLTDSPESGGFYGLGAKGIGPCCAKRIRKQLEEYGELDSIKLECPPDKSFADWIREDIR